MYPFWLRKFVFIYDTYLNKQNCCCLFHYRYIFKYSFKFCLSKCFVIIFLAFKFVHRLNVIFQEFFKLVISIYIILFFKYKF